MAEIEDEVAGNATVEVEKTNNVDEGNDALCSNESGENLEAGKSAENLETGEKIKTSQISAAEEPDTSANAIDNISEEVPPAAIQDVTADEEKKETDVEVDKTPQEEGDNKNENQDQSKSEESILENEESKAEIEVEQQSKKQGEPEERMRREKEDEERQEKQKVQRQRERQQKYNSSATTEIVQSLFGPSVGPCWGDFSCQHNHVRGRLYASSQAVLFYSNLFGFEKRLCLKYEDVVQMCLHRSTSIQISVENPESKNNDDSMTNGDSDNNVTNYIFKAFSDRVTTLQLLIDLWKQSEGEDTVEAEPDRQQHPLEQMGDDAATTSTRSSTPPPRSGGDDQMQKPNQADPTNPPSILRSPRIPPSPFGQRGGDTSEVARKRSRSLPPLHRRKREDKRSISTGFLDDHDVQNIDDNDNLDQRPGNEERAKWENAKKLDDPCIEEVGIKPLMLSCSLDTFYSIFLADDAEFSIDKYMKGEKVKDLDVSVSKWVADTAESGVLTRTIKFRHPVSQSLGLGPSHAPTTKQQRLRRHPGCGICLRSSTTVEGLPGADCFVVEDQWVIERVQNEKENIVNPQVMFWAKFGARFTKRSFLKGMIQKNIRAGNKEWFEGYSAMVQDALQDKLKLDKVSESEPELPQDDVGTRTEALNMKDSSVSTKYELPVNAKTFMVFLALVLLGMAFLLLYVVIQLRRSQRTAERLYEEMEQLRMEQGRILSLLLEKQRTKSP